MNATFIHIPRTAGRFIIATLGLERHIYPSRAKKHFRQEGLVTFGHQDYRRLVNRGTVTKEFNESAFKFAFCRNPFDRVVSHYYHAKKNHPELIPEGVSFKDFVINLEKYNTRRRNFKQQYQSIKNVGLDFIGHFENLEDDLKKVADILKIKLKKVRPIGVTNHKPYQSYYDERTMQKVREFYKQDFDYFGYDHNILH